MSFQLALSNVPPCYRCHSSVVLDRLYVHICKHSLVSDVPCGLVLCNDCFETAVSVLDERHCRALSCLSGAPCGFSALVTHWDTLETRGVC